MIYFSGKNLSQREELGSVDATGVRELDSKKGYHHFLTLTGRSKEVFRDIFFDDYNQLEELLNTC